MEYKTKIFIVYKTAISVELEVKNVQIQNTGMEFHKCRDIVLRRIFCASPFCECQNIMIFPIIA